MTAYAVLSNSCITRQTAIHISYSLDAIPTIAIGCEVIVPAAGKIFPISFTGKASGLSRVCGMIFPSSAKYGKSGYRRQ